MERKLAALVTPALFKLAREGFLVYSDTHRRNFKRLTEDLVIEQYIAVKLPIVVVGRSAIVGLTVAKLAADLHNKGGFVLLKVRVFALLA